MTTYSSTLPSVPTIGGVPFLFGKLAEKLYDRGLVGKPRLKKEKPPIQIQVIESES